MTVVTFYIKPQQNDRIDFDSNKLREFSAETNTGSVEQVIFSVG